jgi:predicted secreted Zn-dependent protease
LRFNEEFYGFTAANAGDIAEALSTFGPELAGERVPAVSRQELEWDYQLSETNGECRLQGAEVRLDITVVLPEWLDAAARPEALRARWCEFDEAVRKHEDGHVSLYIEGARDLLRRVRRVQPGVCETVQQEVDEQGRISIEHYGERQSAYDRDTRGGQTQGVCWAGPGRIC